MCRYVLTLTCVALLVCPSLSLDKAELAKAVDAFDKYFEPPRSNKAKDKEESVATEFTLEEATIKPLEDVQAVTTAKTERVIPVREDVVEDEVVTEKAKCVVGCSINLNVSNPELIQFAKDSLRNIPSGNNFELVQLMQAVREVQNRIIYYLTVEATEECEKEKKETCGYYVICVLKVERHPWRLTKPQLTYQNCTEDSATVNHENDNDRSSPPFSEVVRIPENSVDILENSTNMIESTTMSGDEIISALNEEIIEVAVHNVSNKETNVMETAVSNDEIKLVEATLPSEEVSTFGGTESSNEESTTEPSFSNSKMKILNGEVAETTLRYEEASTSGGLVLNNDESTINPVSSVYETNTLNGEISTTEQDTAEKSETAVPTETVGYDDVTTAQTILPNY